MPKNYTKEQLWELYEKLPVELQEAVFSEENAEHIGTICERYGVKEDQISEVAKFVGRVLMGLLPPEDFQAILKKEVGLKNGDARQVTHEINRFVFSPVKDYLNQLYHIGTVPPEKPTAPHPTEEMPTKAPLEVSEKPTVRREDIYREPLD